MFEVAGFVDIVPEALPVHDRSNVFDNAAQGFAVSSLWPLGPLSRRYNDLGLKLLNGFYQDQPPLLRKVPINRSNPAPEDAINRHTQGSCLSVHRAPATDDQIGMPDQVKAIHYLRGDPHGAIHEKCGAAIPKLV
jgi:hypothetical protein